MSTNRELLSVLPNPSLDRPSRPERRAFLRKAGGVAATVAGSVLAPSLFASGERGGDALAGAETALDGAADEARLRANEAYEVRVEAALSHKLRPTAAHPVNGDETRYPGYWGSFSKTLPHNDLGEVDRAAYEAYVAALRSGDFADVDAVPLGGTGKLVNPLASYAFEMDGPDSHQLGMPAPPAFASAEEAGEMAEVYWQAFTRDVPFISYATDPLIAGAAEDLSRFSVFKGPKSGGRVTPQTLFRGNTPGDLTGHYISQFLYKDIPYGMYSIKQLFRVPAAGNDHMLNPNEWLAVQRGRAPSTSITFDPTPRYIRNGRDLSEYVHLDFSYQAFLNAALILLGMRAPLDPANPYLTARAQASFATFGGPQILDLVARAANLGLKAAWYQKWLVHRRIRPEAFAGRVHHNMNGGASYPIHNDLFRSPILSMLRIKNGSYLLPMAYPEGSPAHPAYPAGHATISGACVTVLKALFDETFVLPNPVVPSEDGQALVASTGDLTVVGELNKLGANISIGRDTAGVHWRTDGIEGLKLGEAVAIGFLRDQNRTFREAFSGFTVTRFDGTVETI